MKITDYLASLLPTFDKNRVVDDVRATREELDDVTIPAYEQAVKVLGNRKLVNPQLVDLQDAFNRIFPGASGNFIAIIEKYLKPTLKNLKELEDVVEKTYNNEVAGLGLSYRKANLLQLIEGYAFATRYARKLLNFAYVAETASLEAKAEGAEQSVLDKIAEQLVPADLEYLKKHIVYFSQVYAVCAGLGKAKDVVKAIEEIPDVIVTKDNAETLTATMGVDKVDPFRMGFIPVWLNPVYHIGMLVTEWQVARYKAAQEELRVLNLRKLKLEKQLDDKYDAKVDQQAKYMQQRVDELEYKIAKMEKRA